MNGLRALTLLRVALATVLTSALAPALTRVLAAQDASILVTFQVVAPSLPDTAAVYIAGSLPALGSWDPGAVRMTSHGNHTWRLTVTLDRPTSIEYKYTRGSWAREAADAAGAAMRNITARVTTDTVLSTTVTGWTSGPRPRVLDGQVTGTLRYHRNVQGDGLVARDVVVWLPPGYAADSTARYPVLYMLDGQNLFDPATSSFGADWAVDEAADSLIRSGAIAPLIVVGMHSTRDRNAEYLPGPTAERHMRFVIDTVKAMIDRTYRTRRDAGSTFAGGSSAGGIAAFMLVWEHPEVFSRALAFSPAFQAPTGSNMRLDYVPRVRDEPRPPAGVRFYMDMGGVGLEDQLRPGAENMLAALKARGYREGTDIRYVHEPGAEHNELAWRRRFAAALVWTLR